jgi:hypothetical protein
MKLVSTRSIAPAALLCFFGSAMMSMPSASQAASKTLTISGTPASSVAVSALYSFQPVAKDKVTSRIKFDIYNKPSWATFDGTTGRLTGRPTSNNVGVYSNISIRLTDWYGYVTTPTFSITVKKAAPPVTSTPVVVNTPPTISGTAVTAINAGAAYVFTPKAADANNDKLSFSIANKPVWATFNATSGTLSGTPTEAEVGTYANIKISVSDAKTSVALPAFTVAVNQVSSGNVVLDWMPPTENTDGSVLTGLAGYTVHYGTSPTALTKVIKVTNPGLTNYVVDDLSSGTWYFAVSSYTSSGTESSNSGVVSTQIM